ncbi:hypothetical protein IWZ03DRAFT_375974 [Phyllosticta citriasiana]|uniref:Secreted protein n=1 Tax=Phyllosticta citriasiana TaxID=595635 RepID=A0ABR1KLI0_9PEZI
MMHRASYVPAVYLCVCVCVTNSPTTFCIIMSNNQSSTKVLRLKGGVYMARAYIHRDITRSMINSQTGTQSAVVVVGSTEETRTKARARITEHRTEENFPLPLRPSPSTYLSLAVHGAPLSSSARVVIQEER